MGIISYAQNFEDVLLFRALGDVGEGFYIDIGAQHPTVDSVSKAFYEAGWRGIHVEPVEAYAQLLDKERRGDVVLRVGIGARNEKARFYEFPDTGLSTAAENVAQVHATSGRVPVEREVDLWTLDNLLAEAAGRTVHWLKIDVEGYEREVLKGWQTSPIRPWVVVIEATFPNTSEETADQWESLILCKGYILAHADGLNRYYIHESQPGLMEALRFGPNVFDQFQLADCVWSTRHVVAQYSKSIGELKGQLEQARHSFQGREQDLKSELGKSRVETEALQHWSAEKLREAQAQQNSTDARLGEAEGALARAEVERNGIADQLRMAQAEVHDCRLKIIDLEPLKAALERERSNSDALRDQLAQQRFAVGQAASDIAAGANELRVVKEQLSAAVAKGEAALMSAKAEWLQEKYEMQSQGRLVLDERDRQLVAAKELLAAQRRESDLQLAELRESTRQQIVDKDVQLTNVVDAAKAWQLEASSKDGEYLARLSDLRTESEEALTAERRAYETQLGELAAQIDRFDAERAGWLLQERELQASLLASNAEAGSLRLQFAQELSKREQATVERLSRDHFGAIKALSEEHEHRFSLLQAEHAQLLLTNDRLLRQVEQIERDHAARIQDLIHEQEVVHAEWNSRLHRAAELQQADLETLRRQGEAVRMDLEARMADALQQYTSLQSERDTVAARLAFVEANLSVISERRHLIKKELERLSLAAGHAETTFRAILATWRAKTRWQLLSRVKAADFSTQAASMADGYGAIRHGIETLSMLAESFRTDRLTNFSANESSGSRSKRSDSRVMHVDELLVMPASEFVEQTYLIILGRQPDSIGRAHYMKRLALGDGNADILFSIAESSEAKGKQGVRLPGLEEFVQTQRKGRRGLGWLIRTISDGKRAANRAAFLVTGTTDDAVQKSTAMLLESSLSASKGPSRSASPELSAGSHVTGQNGEPHSVPAGMASEQTNKNSDDKPIRSGAFSVAAPLAKVRRVMLATRKNTPLSMASASRRTIER